MAAMNRRKKEQIEMWGGTVNEGGQDKKAVDGTTSIEQRLAILRAQTGRKSFDLKELF